MLLTSWSIDWFCCCSEVEDEDVISCRSFITVVRSSATLWFCSAISLVMLGVRSTAAFLACCWARDILFIARFVWTSSDSVCNCSTNARKEALSLGVKLQFEWITDYCD